MLIDTEIKRQMSQQLDIQSICNQDTISVQTVDGNVKEINTTHFKTNSITNSWRMNCEIIAIRRANYASTLLRLTTWHNMYLIIKRW